MIIPANTAPDIKTNNRNIDPRNESKPNEIVLIDQGISDYPILINHIKARIAVHLLDSQIDGVHQITNILQQYSRLDAIHIVSHGNAGYLSLGNSVLSTDTLDKYQETLFSWRSKLNQNADILVYGCNVAKGQIGVQFIHQLAELTGTNIAASSNLTGNTQLGGDWTLDFTTDEIGAEILFQAKDLEYFPSTLVTNTLDFTTDTVTNFVTATHPTANFGTINFKIVNNANSTGTANASLTLATTGSVNDADPDFYYTGTDGEYLVIYTDGREVDFQSVKLGSIGATIYTDITGYAYKDGSLLGSQTINPAGANFPNDNAAITPETVTFTNTIFENADEIRLIGTNNFGSDVGQLLIDDLVLADAVPPNTTPTISIDNASLAYTENAVATQIDAAATLTDADGDADWNGGTLVVQITGNNEAADQLSIVDNAVGTINTSGTNLLNGATIIGTLSASEGTVTNGTALTITFNANATNALVQQVARAVYYSNTSNDPGTSNRTITFSATDKNAAGANDTRTVTVTAVNDEPTLTATGSNPTFTEGGAAASLFSGAAASTIESGQTLTGLTLTVTNVNDGTNERLNTDGTTIVLTHGTSGTTATNSLSYSVSVVGTTATVTLSGGTLSTAAAQTLIDAISYQNNSNTPNTSNRVVTITSLTDSGGTANGGDDTAALAIASTVTVTAVNDEPTLTATGSNPTFTEGGAAASLFSGAAASTIESGQTLTGLTLTVTNVNDGANERLNTDGTTIVLTHGTSGTTATNSLSYSVSVVGTTATVTLSGGTLSTAAAQTLIDAISYQNNSNTPNTNNRVVTITSLTDSGGTANGGDDNAALAISSTVTVAANPAITSATYDYNTNQLVVTGTDFVTQAGAANDVDISLITITGEGGASYTLTNATDVEIDSPTQFTVTLSGSDLVNVETLLNKNGTSADDNTIFNLAAADNWMTGTSAIPDISDATNAITVSNYTVPTLTSATYDISTGQLVITGADLVSKSGAANDLDASLLTITGEGGNYTLTDTSDVDITSATSATLTLSTTDQLNVNGLLNKIGTTSSGAVTYNLAAADNWITGAPASNAISDTTGNGITVSNVATPTIISAAYDAATHTLFVTGTNLFKKPGANNDIDASLFTIVGGNSATYTLASTSDAEITSSTSFTINVTGSDQTQLYSIFDQLGTQSSFGTNYNIQAADHWLTAADPAVNIADNNAEGGVTVTVNPQISSSTYDVTTGALVVTGSNIEATAGAANDIIANKFTFTGEGGATYTLTDSPNVERDNISQFTVTLSATDKTAVNLLFNKNGTASVGGTTYNLAVADDWCACPTSAAADISDLTGNGITVSNVPVPTITSATYDASTGALVVTGTDLMSTGGAANDIIANKFTFTGEGGDIYTLTDTPDVDITSGTAFTLTLSATDKAAVNQIINKDGTASTDATTYNLSAAEDWAAGTDAAVNVVDATGNGITASNVAVPTITSATYNTGTGVLVVTGTNFLKASGAANDIIANKFTFTGESGASYTLTDTVNAEITSSTVFTLTLSATDKTAVNLLTNKNGTVSDDATTYNLAAAEDWAAGADAAVNVVDAAGNGITVTIPAPPSGGGGGGGSSTPSTPTTGSTGDTNNTGDTTTDNITTTTVDGVNISTQTETDGSRTVSIPVVDSARTEDPDTFSEMHADIPILTNDSGNPVLSVSLPTNVGLAANGQSEPMSTQNAISNLVQRIEQETINNNDVLSQMTIHGQNFIASLSQTDRVSVQTMTLTPGSSQSPGLPVIISGSNLPDDGKQALIINAADMPSGTVIQLDNIAFAAIIGAARVVSGAGANFVAGDNQNQYIVLGADDDILFGGGGDDTVGSLGGNDQTAGDAGDDIVFGGTGHDNLTGGSGNDALNGGLGFDTAAQAGQMSDYQIHINSDHITFTNDDGNVDTFTDIELVEFANGPSLAIAHSAAEAAAHHLVKTWLGRDLTPAEGSAVQSWVGADAGDIVNVFRNLPEADDFKNMTAEALLAGINNNPNIIQLDIVRDLVGSDNDDQGYLPLGLALNADGGGGHDVLQMTGGRSDVHLAQIGDTIEITHLEDGAMLSLKNVEMIAFDSGENVLLAHTQVENILGRLFQTFFDRDATIDEWQLGREAIAKRINPDIVLDWFQRNADLKDLDDDAYIQALYSQTFGRNATEIEMIQQQFRLNNGSISREWLAVDIANSDEAITTIGSVLLLDGNM